MSVSEITERQEEVLALIVDGYTFGEIAERLGISERTVKSHSDLLRRKLGAERKRNLILLGRDYLAGKAA